MWLVNWLDHHLTRLQNGCSMDGLAPSRLRAPDTYRTSQYRRNNCNVEWFKPWELARNAGCASRKYQ